MNEADFSPFLHSSARSANEGNEFLSIPSLITVIGQRMKRIFLHSFTHQLDLLTKATNFSPFVHSSAGSGNERSGFLSIRSLNSGIRQRRQPSFSSFILP
ncbi:hypothetical protein [Virgibacillus sp. YIM 98842]|uniref:hypothetical protein n=1 Tax=Virgibacillus sp. YIM 98842 TaxID=2663533 RepID=UPI0013DA63BF|nr:hypothetical protein [Virgibacillus sp. YIM 98842]